MRWPALPRRPPDVSAPHPLRQIPGADALPVVMVTLFRADEAAIAMALQRHARPRRHRCVMVAATLDLAPFRRAGVVLEMLPPPAMVRLHRHIGDWPAYLEERWRMLRSKWRPDVLMTVGGSFADYLRACDLSVSFSESEEASP